MMSWVVCEGLDRTGKSTVAEYYRKQGYKVIHMSAPDKKYQDEYYTGPSYLDEVLDLLMEHDGKKVFWDRSYFGERIWPHVYGRKPCLTDEDFEIIREYEDRNNTKHILMIDPNIQAHWQRCVDNNEPLTKRQFDLANNLYSRLAHTEAFVPRTLGDFDEKFTGDKGEDNITEQAEEPIQKEKDQTDATNIRIVSESKVEKTVELSDKKAEAETPSQIKEKLDRANAINSILSKRIIKSKGEIYDQIEVQIKDFLNKQLSELMGTSESAALSKDEVQILKVLCKQWKTKLENKI